MMRLVFVLLSFFLVVSCKKTDKKDASAPKTVYYRVKMVDKNGHITFSQVKSVVEK